MQTHASGRQERIAIRQHKVTAKFASRMALIEGLWKRESGVGIQRNINPFDVVPATVTLDVGRGNAYRLFRTERSSGGSRGMPGSGLRKNAGT